MKKIAVVSGKGGAGKTSMVAALAFLAGRKHAVVAVDCDVDAPNLGKILRVKVLEEKETFTSEKAKINKNLCKKCHACMLACNFSAIKLGKDGFPEIAQLYCEGCGACMLACQNNAIALERVKNGRVVVGKSKFGVSFVGGVLDIGESGSGKIITEVKKKACELAKREKARLVLIDSSPGIGCPVIASLSTVDFALLVTEPSLSAFHDLKRILEVVEHFGIEKSVVINKANVNEKIKEKILEFCKRREIKVIAEFPYDNVFIKSVNNLVPLPLITDKYNTKFFEILKDFKVI